jgi:hypothetical protein
MARLLGEMSINTCKDLLSRFFLAPPRFDLTYTHSRPFLLHYGVRVDLERTVGLAWVQIGLTPSHLAFFCLQLRQAALTGPSLFLPSGRVGPVMTSCTGDPVGSRSGGVCVLVLSGVMECRFKCDDCAEPGFEPLGEIVLVVSSVGRCR